MYQDTIPIEHSTAFHLKHEGHLQDALHAYAGEYKIALHMEDAFVREVCLAEMVDICLLEYLKSEERFETREQLHRRLQGELTEHLQRAEAFSRDHFQDDLRAAWRKLSRGVGRGRRPYSVDLPQLGLSRGRQKEPA